MAAEVGVRQQRHARFDAEQLEPVGRLQGAFGDLLGGGVELDMGVEEEPQAAVVDHAGHRRGAGDAGVEVEHAAQVAQRSEEHTSELQSLMRISYAVFCLKKKKTDNKRQNRQEVK